MVGAEASLAICSDKSAFSPDREASFKHHGKVFGQHRWGCDSTIFAGVCPFASLEITVYDPSAQALRNSTSKRCVKGTVIGSSSSIAYHTINACGLAPAQSFVS